MLQLSFLNPFKRSINIPASFRSFISLSHTKAFHNPNAMSIDGTASPTTLPTPYCYNMLEHPSATAERLRLQSTSPASPGDNISNPDLSTHIMHGLAYTVGSALGCSPPPVTTCLEAFLAENKARLTAGSRAWSKHSHRSQSKTAEKDDLRSTTESSEKAATDDEAHEKRVKRLHAEEESAGWWGVPSGPVAKINENSIHLFWKVMNNATWRNLHWLPHQVLAYEVRVPAGYGMRWSQDWSPIQETTMASRQLEISGKENPWTFRGFLEPQMENGHEVGWRH